VGNGLQLSIGKQLSSACSPAEWFGQECRAGDRRAGFIFSGTSLFLKSCPTKPVKPKTDTKSQPTSITTPIPLATQVKTTSRQLEGTVTN
jgi:hypothetical protein